MRKFAFLGFVFIFLFLCSTALRADDTILFTIQVSPDALIGFDLSGSMNRPPGGDNGYSSSVDSKGYCSGDKLYYTPTGSYKISCGNHGVPDGYAYTNSTACTEPYYKYSSSNKVDCSKLAIAKRAIFNMLDDNNDGKIQTVDQQSLNTRVGYMRFRGCCEDDPTLNYDEGCNTMQFKFPNTDDPKQYQYSQVFSKIDAEDIPDGLPGYRTPLALQLQEAKDYLDDHKDGDPAKECRKKFIIFITDGWDTTACSHNCNQDESVTGSYGYMRRRATLAAVKPITDAGYRVFVVGFGADLPDTEENTLEWCAFYGGTDNPKVDNSGNTSAITPSDLLEAPCTKFDGCKDKNGQPSQKNCINAPRDPGYKDLTGYAFLAADATKLGESLTSIIRYILEKSFSYTAPTIPSVRLIEKDVVYVSSFIPDETPFWRGNMKAYRLEEDGTLPVDNLGNPLNSNLLWDAFDNLKVLSPDNRKIYTVNKNGDVKEFNEGQLTKEDLNVDTDLKRSDLVNHVRGYDSFDIDQDLNTTEPRNWKLGDLFHSNAVIVGAPNQFFEDNTEIGYDGKTEYAGAIAAYKGHYDDRKNRKKVIIAGANDGMLHFFDTATGDEVGAFIPPSVRPSLKLMKERWDQYKSTGSSGGHLYYVDGSPRASEVWVPSYSTDKTKSKDEWHTVLVCGLRKGGKAYFALGITNTESTWQGFYPPIGRGFLWEFPSKGKNYNYDDVYAKMGQSWSDPAIGRIKIEGADGELYERWVAFIGGGYDATNATGNCFFVVDVWTGELIKEFSGLTGGSGKTFSMPAPPKAVDVNGDGYVDKVYIGSLGNQMWVFDVSFNAVTKKSVSQWSGKILFQAPGSPPNTHPVYTQAAVAVDWNSTVWVYFGTGDREDPMSSTCNEIFTAVKDDGKGSYPRGYGDLKEVTNHNTFTSPSDPPYKGWFIKLDTKEKVLAKPTIFNGLVYFTTYSPAEDPEPCTTGGVAKLYVVEFLSGGGALNVDDLSDFQNAPGDRSKVIGSGIPSDPVVSVNLKGQASVIVGTTSAEVYSQRAFSLPVNKQFIYWREIIP